MPRKDSITRNAPGSARGLLAFAMAATLAPSVGCSFLMRDADRYRNDTQAQLDTRRGQVQACYDTELANNPSARGKLTLQFTMEKKTGRLSAPRHDPDRSSVSEALATCVVSAIDGVEIEPDQRDGAATWVYYFDPGAGASRPDAVDEPDADPDADPAEG